MELEKITPNEFIKYEESNSRSAKNEWLLCIDPKFTKYRTNLEKFLSNDVYPTYRLNESGTALTSVFENNKATPITFTVLAKRPELLTKLLGEGYVSKDNTLLVYHCESCCVWLVKDGIHRLFSWIVEKENREIFVYQVTSINWSNATVDMPNFCKCKK